MISEALTALAAAGGTAVVQAAGTDAWEGVRHRVARLLSRGDPEREQAELGRLERTARALAEAPRGAGAGEEARRQAAAWRAAFEMMLESLPEPGRAQAAAELAALTPRAGGSTSVVAGNTFNGPAAVMTGDHDIQQNVFGTGPWPPAPPAR